MRKLHTAFALYIFVLALICAPIAQATQEQSLSGALTNAYLNNPTLRSARLQLKVTEEQLTQAHSNYLPDVTSNAGVTSSSTDNSNSGTDKTTSKDIGVSFDQPLYRGGRTVAAVRSARHAITAKAADLDEQEQNLLLNAITAYVDVLRDQHIIALRQQNIASITQELEAAQLRFEVGNNTKTDVALAQSRLARAQADLTAAVGALETSAAAYEEIIGQKPNILHAPVLNVSFPDSLETTKDQALTTHPKIIQAQANYKSAEHDIDKIFGELLPEVNLSGLWKRTYDPQSSIDQQTNRSVGVQATIPLYMGGGTRSRMRAAKYTAQDYEAQIETTKREVTQKLVTEWASWTATKNEIQARESQTNAAQIALEGMKLERDLGIRSTLDVLSADQDLIAAQEAVLNAQRNEVIARFGVLAATGLLTKEHLSLQNVDEP